MSGNKEFAFTIFPKSPKFIKPAEQPLNYPSARKNDKFVQFTALYHLDLRTTNVLYLIGEAFSGIAAIH